MGTHGCEGHSGQKCRVVSEPKFQKLRRLIKQMPADRREAALDHLKHEHDESTTEETQSAVPGVSFWATLTARSL